ncbi:MAG: DUF5597 domain-containing protein [Staphylococcus sp.]|nr:DUF5597 domain-containing protein [Staphylococcus sp.]
MRLPAILLTFLLVCPLCFARTESRLERQGSASRLIVDGKPFIIVGGESGNSMASSAADVATCLESAAAHGYNTVLLPVAWELIEPAKGEFDFSSVDNIIRQATDSGIRIGILWFGAWKNSMSCYAPSWFKNDSKAYPRARTRSGKPLEIASAFSQNVFDADANAFSHLLRHIAETDTAGTVIILQIENEIGMLEEARDHSQLAQKEYDRGVPAELMAHLNKNKKSLHPQLLAKWKEAGMKQKGSWTEVFGDDIYTDEIFMAWNYGRYVGALARLAREIFPTMPLYVNAAMNSRGRQPGEYPSAGPLAHLKDIWHAAAPRIDFLSPDLYDSGFTDWVKAYSPADNQLFIPEIKCGQPNAAQLHYAVGEHNAIGLCPFAFNNRRNSSDCAYQRRGNENIRELTPVIARHLGTGDMNGLYFDADSTSRTINRDGMNINAKHFFTLPWDPRATDGSVWPAAGGLIIRLAPMDYIIAGSGIVVTFEPEGKDSTPQAKLGEDGFLAAGSDREARRDDKWQGKRIGLASVEQVSVDSDGNLHHIRTLNGDETHQGRHVRIGVDDFEILHVRLYEYE